MKVELIHTVTGLIKTRNTIKHIVIILIIHFNITVLETEPVMYTILMDSYLAVSDCMVNLCLWI